MVRGRRRPMSVLVGAYAASPAHAQWAPEAEEEYFDGLAALATVRGLELPWIDGLHPHDDAWLLRRFPRRFDAVLTGIPGTMRRLGRDPRFGLASPDAEGRADAVAEAVRMLEAAERLNDACGRRAVIAVELHSAPVASADPAAEHAAVAALRESLESLAATGAGDGAALVVEHCDAFVPGRAPEKGFLAVADELAALDGLPDRFGMSVNWGRSAIELRDGDAVAAQLAQVAASGRLRGLMLSGAADQATPFGPAWVDAHHPMTPGPGFPYGEPASLLTAERLAAAVAAAGPIEWAGVKFGWADPSAGVAPRVAMVDAATTLLTRTMATPHSVQMSR
ncbi:DUF4862 family protein [Leifsonia sp. WHRI 6310E]|uniref:DUF4862 family protein n=1 Tax=Leifsonia sp. WHRI 6310E TaxID=3162562 RepID=UPI0035A915E4